MVNWMIKLFRYGIKLKIKVVFDFISKKKMKMTKSWKKKRKSKRKYVRKKGEKRVDTYYGVRLFL